MSPQSLGRATIATSSDRGAIGTVLIRTEHPERAVAAHFSRFVGPKPLKLEIGRIYFGTWNASAGSGAEETGEEVVVARVSDHQLEVHCHGGRVAANRILADLVSAGLEPVDALPPEPSGGRIACAAAELLPHALTARGALMLVDQVNGALDQRLQAIIANIGAGHLDEAAAALDRLVQTAACGTHLTQPWRVAIVGQPNVGKSSLLNAISGYDRAIVFDEPGTTRDSVTVQTAIDGWPFEFVDTAGVREAAESLERQGVERSFEVARQADQVVLVCDVSLPWSDADQALLSSGGCVGRAQQVGPHR